MPKKRKKRIRLRHIIVCFLLVYIVLVFINQRRLMNELNSKKTRNELAISILEKEIEDLNKEITESDSLDFIEKVAREELGLVKPREIIYIDINKRKNPFQKFFRRLNN